MIRRTLTNERGSVLLISLLMLMILTLIGIQALDTTDIELIVTRNDRTSKEAFHAADGGGFVAIKIVSQALNESASPVLPATIVYIDDNDPLGSDDFYRELIGVDTYESGNDLSFPVSPTTNALVDVEQLGVVNFAGGGAEFASSYTGVGASGPKGAYYGIRTQVTAPNNTKSQVYVRYMKALGVAGGL